MTPRLRAWIIEDRQMADIHVINFVDRLISTNLHIELAFDEIVLMQSTSLKDRNGVEIFDGDVCEHPEGNDRFVVKYDPYDGFKANYDNGETLYLPPQFDRGEAVVIGNIHENPELLKVPHG